MTWDFGILSPKPFDGRPAVNLGTGFPASACVTTLAMTLSAKTAGIGTYRTVSEFAWQFWHPLVCQRLRTDSRPISCGPVGPGA